MEQKSVIYFLYRKEMKTKEIKTEPDQVYQDQTLSFPEVYYWKRMFAFGRADLNNIPNPGRTLDEGIDSSILLVLEKNPRTTAHQIVSKLGIAVSTVIFTLDPALFKCTTKRI